MSVKLERAVTAERVELREAAEGAGPRVLRGYAAVYDSLSQNLGGFVEVLRKGCFDEALANHPDVYCRVQHEGGVSVVGRTISGTLRVGSDSKGLWYECDLPDTQVGRDIATLVDRGDINQSSFEFSVARREDERWDWNADPPVREILRCGLHDVAPVSGPAYEATSVWMRGRDVTRRVKANALANELRREVCRAKAAALVVSLR